MTIPSVTRLMKTSPNVSNRPSVHTQTSFSIQSCGTCYAILYLCQRPLYKILVKVRNSKINVLKIVLIIVNINKEENKSLISNQFSLLKMIPPPPPHKSFFKESINIRILIAPLVSSNSSLKKKEYTC